MINTDSGARNHVLSPGVEVRTTPSPGCLTRFVRPNGACKPTTMRSPGSRHSPAPRFSTTPAEAERAALLGDQSVITRIAHWPASRPTHDPLARPLRRTHRPATAHPEA
jgi:hypothetical protein